MQENSYTEFKSSFNDGVIESLVAFANTSGGKVLIGVNDSGLAVKRPQFSKPISKAPFHKISWFLFIMKPKGNKVILSLKLADCYTIAVMASIKSLP